MVEQSTINFIQEVEKQECLYNSSLPQYSQRHAVEIAWTIVATTCKMSVTECKEKWRNLRTTFTRKNKDNSGDKKPYYLHDYMKFIIPYIKPLQKSYGNIEFSNSTPEPLVEQNIFVDVNERYEPTVSDNPITQNRKRKGEETEKEYLNVLQNRQIAEGSGGHRTENPRRCFLLSLMDEVSDFDNSEMRLFKRKVLQVVDDIVEARNTHYPYSVQSQQYSPNPTLIPQKNLQSAENQNISATILTPEETVVKIEYL